MNNEFKVSLSQCNVRDMIAQMIDNKYNNKLEIIDYLTYHVTDKNNSNSMTVDELFNIYMGGKINHVPTEYDTLQNALTDESVSLVRLHRFNYWDFDKDRTSEMFGVFTNPNDTDEDYFYLNCTITETFKYSVRETFLIEEQYCDPQGKIITRTDRVNLDNLHIMCDGVFGTVNEYLNSIA